MAEIWESTHWPDFTYDRAGLGPLLLQFSEAVGEVRGLHAGLTHDERQEIILRELTRETVHSFAIEGVKLNEAEIQASVVASLADRTLSQASRRSDNIVAMLRDARQGRVPLTEDRLFAWHRLLFEKSGLEDVGQWRSFEMVIAKSDIAGRDDILYKPVPAARVSGNMERFLDWINAEYNEPAAAKAAIAHLWFESIHPFSDGNGRIGRALIEHVFAQTAVLPFSFSRHVEAEKAAYYDALQAGRKEGRGGIDATQFVQWFLQALMSGVDAAKLEGRFLAMRNRFFMQFSDRLSDRQVSVLQRLFVEGAERVGQGISAKAYVKIAKVSSATATRDLADMELKRVLSRSESGGRSTRYLLRLEG